MRETFNNTEELRNILIEIGDLSGRLSVFSQNAVFKQGPILQEFLELTEKFNNITARGNIPRSAAKTAFWHYAMDCGFYPCQVNRTQTIFVKHSRIVDVRDHLKQLLNSTLQQPQNPIPKIITSKK